MKYLMLDVLLTVLVGFASLLFIIAYIVSTTRMYDNIFYLRNKFIFKQIERVKTYSKSLPYERVTRGSKSKVL